MTSSFAESRCQNLVSFLDKETYKQDNKHKFLKSYHTLFCWFDGSSFKGFSIVFPALWLAKVESSQKSNGMWFFRHSFAPYLFHRSRNNRRDKLRSKFWPEKMFSKPHLKLLRWCSVRGTNNFTHQFCSTDTWTVTFNNCSNRLSCQVFATKPSKRNGHFEWSAPRLCRHTVDRRPQGLTAQY